MGPKRPTVTAKLRISRLPRSAANLEHPLHIAAPHLASGREYNLNFQHKTERGTCDTTVACPGDLKTPG